MKKICLVVLLLCLCAPGLSEQAWAPEGVDIGGSRTPLPMPEGVMLSDVYPEFIPSLPQGYFINDAEYDGQPFILLYREGTDGGSEILMSVVQEETTPHALVYVEGSYEQSSGKFLYFILVNGKTLHGSLYLFSMEDNRMNLVLNEPCSNNMAIFEKPDPDFAGLGWVVWQDYILPINLEDGSSYEYGAAVIADLGGMPEISGDFFKCGITQNERKYTFVKPMDNNILCLTTVIIDTTEQNPQRTIVQYYDCVNKCLTQP